MKKILSMLLVLSMLLGFSVAVAEMGVQIIGGPDVETEPVSLDDLKLNASVVIDDYAEVLLTAFTYDDVAFRYASGNNRGNQFTKYDSGADAEYAILRVDLTNLSTSAHNFLQQCEVKVVYDDKYEYQGWAYQYNYDNGKEGGYVNSKWYEANPLEWTIHQDDNFAIDPMYQGHYCFGCTLPNAVVNSKSPMRMIITIDGNELTYNIRK